MTSVVLRRRVLAAALVLGAIAGPATSAAADPATEGLWYFDALRIQDAHDAGFTGAGITIAVLDAQINPDIPTLRDANLELGEQPDCYIDGVELPAESTDVLPAEHATNVVSLIVGTGADEAGVPGVKGIAPGATVLFYRVNRDNGYECTDADGEPRYEAVIADALESALDAGVDIISLSLGFNTSDQVGAAVARGLSEGVIFVVALSNQEDIMDSLAWSPYLNGGVSVQAAGSDLAIQTHDSGFGDQVPNIDQGVDVAAPGIGILYQGTPEGGWSTPTLRNGTSLATPIVAGILAVAAQKYPDATSNQLLQSLIRNTGGNDGEPEYDASMQYGYGIASLTNLLKVDPTQYPDENPLLVATGDPSLEAIEAAGAEPTAEPSPPPGASAGIPGWLIVILVAGTVAVLVIVAVVVLVMVRRSLKAKK